MSDIDIDTDELRRQRIEAEQALEQAGTTLMALWDALDAERDEVERLSQRSASYEKWANEYAERVALADMRTERLELEHESAVALLRDWKQRTERYDQWADPYLGGLEMAADELQGALYTPDEAPEPEAQPPRDGEAVSVYRDGDYYGGWNPGGEPVTLSVGPDSKEAMRYTADGRTISWPDPSDHSKGGTEFGPNGIVYEVDEDLNRVRVKGRLRLGPQGDPHIDPYGAEPVAQHCAVCSKPLTPDEQRDYGFRCNACERDEAHDRVADLELDAMELGEWKKEAENLRHDLDRYMRIANEEAERAERLERENERFRETFTRVEQMLESGEQEGIADTATIREALTVLREAPGSPDEAPELPRSICRRCGDTGVVYRAGGMTDPCPDCSLPDVDEAPEPEEACPLQAAQELIMRVQMENIDSLSGESNALLTRAWDELERAIAPEPEAQEYHRSQFYADQIEQQMAEAQESQPARCASCGYLVTDSEHRGCIRAGQPARVPESLHALADYWRYRSQVGIGARSGAQQMQRLCADQLEQAIKDAEREEGGG